MTMVSAHRVGSAALGWLALGVTMIAGAFTLHPTHVSKLVFWAVAGIGFAAVACGIFSARRGRRPSKRELLANECFRLKAAINSLVVEQEEKRPRKSRFGSSDRIQDWADETRERYDQELRPWAEQTYRLAAKQGGLSTGVSPLLAARTIFQLRNLGELFQGVGESLMETV